MYIIFLKSCILVTYEKLVSITNIIVALLTRGDDFRELECGHWWNNTFKSYLIVRCYIDILCSMHEMLTYNSV